MGSLASLWGNAWLLLPAFVAGFLAAYHWMSLPSGDSTTGSDRGLLLELSDEGRHGLSRTAVGAGQGQKHALASPQSLAARGEPQTAGPRVCWPPSRHKPSGEEAVILVHGSGCSFCWAGELCSFAITLLGRAADRGNATDVVVPTPGHAAEAGPTAAAAATTVHGWRPFNISGPFQWDLMVSLMGPSAAYAAVTPDPAAALDAGGAPLAFVAQYRVWEAGEYRATLFDCCSRLLGVRPLFKLKARENVAVATWKLSVLQRPNAEQQAGEAVSLRSPCGATHAPLGRWLLRSLAPSPNASNPVAVPHKQGSKHRSASEYTWAAHSCFPPPAPLPLSLCPLALRNIREVVLVGDSQLRWLLLHMVYLSTGVYHDAYHNAHDEFQVNTTLSCPETVVHNATIVFKFYFVGRFFPDGEFGCWEKMPREWGTPREYPNMFPNISSSTDLLLLAAGTWTAGFCEQPVLSYTKYLTRFLEYMTSQIGPTLPVVFYGSLPQPRCIFGPQSTNSLFYYMHNYARTICAHYGARMHFFPAWEVAAPLYYMGADFRHYSSRGPATNLPQGLTQNRKKVKVKVKVIKVLKRVPKGRLLITAPNNTTDPPMQLKGQVGKGLAIAMLHFLDQLLTA